MSDACEPDLGCVSKFKRRYWKKELVGDFKNARREWHPRGQPPAVRVHDFQDAELGKAIPCSVYDLSANAG